MRWLTKQVRAISARGRVTLVNVLGDPQRRENPFLIGVVLVLIGLVVTIAGLLCVVTAPLGLVINLVHRRSIFTTPEKTNEQCPS